MSNITNFFVKHKDNIVITILIIGMFILSDSYDWEHMSKSAMREFDLGLFIVFVAFYYNKNQWPDKPTIISFCIAFLTVGITIALNSYFSN